MATDLREALRPVVAFRGMLEKATELDQLRLSILETNLPDHISKVLDLHQALMMSLALVSKAETPDTIEDRVEKQLIAEQQPPQPEIYIPPSASFTDD